MGVQICTVTLKLDKGNRSLKRKPSPAPFIQQNIAAHFYVGLLRSSAALFCFVQKHLNNIYYVPGTILNILQKLS